MQDGKRPMQRNRIIMLLAVLLFVAMSLIATSMSLAYAGSHIGSAVITPPGSNASHARNIRSITAATGGCPVPSFGPPTSYPVGDFPTSVTSADFNNDGNLDLATTNNTPSTVSILLGNGTGGFGPATNFPAADAPGELTSADFNEDGNADLAVARPGAFPDNVSILLGNGMGGFGPPAVLVAGTTPDTIKVGDFNEDGNLDLTTSNFNSHDVSIFLGNGMGGFSPATNFPAGGRPSGVAVGDVNEDGHLDLVVSNFIIPDVISVLLGNGMGGFGGPSPYETGDDIGPLALGDYNEDTHLDVAVRSGSTVSILLGNGGGGFGPPTLYPAGGRSSSIVARDFTHDGHLDLALANNIPSNVAVLAGDGTGVFSPPVTFPAGPFPGDIVAGDFNEDGSLDLAVANGDSDIVSVLLNACLPATTATPSHTPTSTSTATSTHTATQSATPTATATDTITVPATSTATRTVAPPTATACPIQFTDVPANHTFYTSIRCLACRGIVSGYSDGTFRPNNQVTRGQLAKMVSNAAGFSEPVSGQTFEDVPLTNTFYEWIERLTTRGYMTGYLCGGPGEPCTTGRPYFRPFANATRGQTAKIVSNAAMFTEPPVGQTFEDVPPTHTFYEFIQRLASRNVMQGYPCGGPGEPCTSGRPYFRPGNDVTRGQSAKIVANTFYPACNP